jgi:hypothetical protein
MLFIPDAAGFIVIFYVFCASMALRLLLSGSIYLCSIRCGAYIYVLKRGCVITFYNQSLAYTYVPLTI